MKNKLVYGVGINDADYEVTANIDGKQIGICPFYQRWKNMLMRCYCVSYRNKYPSYQGCSVSKEWKYFSKFKCWMETHDWEGKELDKDILFPGNKVYSPTTCVFVSKEVNYFITESTSNRGSLPIGVFYRKETGKYRARIGCGYKGGRINLGNFDTPEKAHQAWLTAKLEQAKMIASEQSDPRIAEALVKRYENYKETV